MMDKLNYEALVVKVLDYKCSCGALGQIFTDVENGHQHCLSCGQKLFPPMSEPKQKPNHEKKVTDKFK